MKDLMSKISNFKLSIFIIALVFILAVIFETFQQIYFVTKYNIVENVSFWDVLKSQLNSWVIWCLMSIVLFFYSKSQSHKKLDNVRIVNYVLVIFVLVFLCVFIISLSRLLYSNDNFSLALLGEYLTFFIFQKATLYTLGYIAIAMILRLYFENEKLQIEVQELSELKLTNARLFKKLNSTIDEKATVLNIKIGNKRKIIPVEDISWIEADDYCVKVHTTNNGSYTMRSSLKALEEKLSTNFLRVHRKAIVNMSFAKELHISGSPNLILENDLQIPVSKSNLKTVKDFLN
ncbi:LytTR family DNA-binding domain-containing protein [uncultured Psychroserpens sp.]|uniref:LytR/AlgR family response regulator transcription factor n=1 Tax=uncultured Psychroserpens sp. TaxID=255436 RepID=UPI00262D49D3|nr:LytTR family DNA-binding domain-containing protein [uncultured Psychroserpens sp.]